MKRLKLLICLLCPLIFILFFVSISSGENLLKFFHGGVHNANLKMNNGLTSGIGVHESSAGIGITTLRPSPAAVHWNPAGLAFMKKGGIIVEAIPGIATSPDMSETINEEVDASFENMVKDADTVIEYPDFTFTGGQGGRPLTSFAIAFPYMKNFYGVSYHRAFSLNMEMMSSGVENKISTIEEDPNDNSTIFTRTDINLLLDFTADVLEVAMGGKFSKNIGAGLTVGKIYTDGFVNGIIRPDGMFTRRGAEKAFNDESAGWQNDFYSSMIGGFSGGAWGVKAGLAFQKNEKFGLNLLMNLNQNVKMHGDMEIIQYTYPALNMNAEGDEESFDLDLIDNFAQPTETVMAETVASDEFLVNTPSSISIGAAYRSLSLTITNYFGELSYEYEIAKNGHPILYSRGLKLKQGFLLGIDTKYFRMGVGGIMADEIVEGYTDDNGEPVEPTTGVILPRFNLGTGYKLNESWNFDLLLIAAPDLFGSLFKVGVVYTIN